MASPTGVGALGLKVAAAFTRLLVDQATARFEAVVDQPIGVAAAGYDVPGPRAVVDWFAHAPDPPELAHQFLPEVAANEWQRLQAVHAIVDTLSPVEDAFESGMRQHLQDRLAHYKLPRSIEYVREPLRDDAGKVRRSALREARIGRVMDAGQ